MKSIGLGVVLFLAFALMFGGCRPMPKEKVYTRMGESAPAWKQGDAWTGFLAGRWAVTLFDPSAAQSLGINIPPPEGGEPISDWYEFAADGTFKCDKSGYKMSGKWKDEGAKISLSYDELNGKPMQAALAEIRANAEKGARGAIQDDIFLDWVQSEMQKMMSLELHKDTKSLSFGSAQADSSGMFSVSPPRLERLKAQ